VRVGGSVARLLALSPRGAALRAPQVTAVVVLVAVLISDCQGESGSCRSALIDSL
jgi:hypothetical protein